MSAGGQAVRARPADGRRVVIIGGGFGGLRAAQTLARSPYRVTLIDRRNFHLFQPLLYQVATGGLSPANIAAPLRSVLKRARNVRVILGTVTDIDAQQRCVRLGERAIPYDALIVSVGVENHYYGHDEWSRLALGLKSIEDATEIRRRLLLAFEAAEVETEPRERRLWLSFLVVGAGPTGVELAGTLAEIARHTLRREYRSINPAEARIVLLEGADRVLPTFAPELSARATRALGRLGVHVRTRCRIVGIRPDHVEIEADGRTQVLEARTVLWAAGVRVSALGRRLADVTGAATDPVGRIVVNPDCTIPGYPEVFVVGDLAHLETTPGQALPAVAPVAVQQGRYVARVLHARLRGRRAGPFRYRDRGMMATIGRSAAIVDLFNRIRLNGFVAWLTWLFVHLFYLIAFQNRVLVLVQWAWNYFTWSRSSRLIINYRGEHADDPP